MARKNRSVNPTLLERLESRILFANQAIWIEGENYASTTFNHWWLEQYNTLDATQLSPGVPGSTNGAWVAQYNGSQVGSVQSVYNFTCPEAGTYTFWARLQTYQMGSDSTYSVKLDNGAFTTLDMTDLASQQNLALPQNGTSFDGRVVGWVYGGQLSLTAGAHTLTVKVSNTYGTLVGAIDALAMTNYSWAPSGAIKPSPSATPGPSDWFPFGAGPDQYSANSVIDLSYLNSSPAGSHGYLTQQGENYQFQDGTSVKFWGVDAMPTTTPGHIAAQAKWYAKNGVNIVRLAHFDGYFDTTKRDAQGNFILDPTLMDRYDRFFAALKANGIYSDWSMVWMTPIQPIDGYPTALYNELPWVNSGDTSQGKNSYGIVNFMTQLQDIRWKFVSALLNHVNPYTGLKYANDPALAIVEEQNEDDIYFWNPLSNVVDGSMPQTKAQLQLQWQQWVKAKYGTNAALQSAWGAGFLGANGTYGADGVDQTNMKVYDAWQINAANVSANEQPRLADFIKFLSDTQRAYYSRRITQIRGTGFQGVIVATNWQGGGQASNAPNLYDDSTADAVDRHGYWQSGDGDWRIVTTDTNGNGIPGEFQSASQLLSPGGGLLNAGMYQWENKPFDYSEWSAVPPNQYIAEAAPLQAFYGMGLQGWDASFQFASSRYYYSNGWGNTIFTSLYNSDTPAYMGQFPALALAARQGYVAEGQAAATRHISYNNAMSGVDAFTQSLTNGGWNGATGDLSIPNQVLAIGRVSNQIGNGLSPSTKQDWTSYWNQTTKTITSNTGQLAWDYGNGIVQVKAPKEQGVIGFGGGKTFDLGDISVNLTTGFADLLFTSLDGKPISQSAHILVIALARSKQLGATYSADGTQLLTMGGEPLMMEPVQATVTMKNGSLGSVTPLDVYGVPTNTQLPLSGNTFTIDGRYATYYYEINRSADTTPPTMLSVQVNDGSVQRSKISQLTVTFSERVNLGANAISILLRNGSPLAGLLYSVANPTGDLTNYTVTFSGITMVGGSIPDGAYRLTVSAAGVQDMAGNQMAADGKFRFFRMFGDSNGDRMVDRADLIAFRNALNNPTNYGYFDSNGDGLINSADLIQLRLHLLRPLL